MGAMCSRKIILRSVQKHPQLRAGNRGSRQVRGVTQIKPDESPLVLCTVRVNRQRGAGTGRNSLHSASVILVDKVIAADTASRNSTDNHRVGDIELKR